MMLLYVDAFSGVSGDMLLGALLDAGLPEADLRKALGQLPLEGYDLAVSRPIRRGIRGTRALVRLAPSAHAHGRHLADIEALIAGAALPGRAAEWSTAVFRRLADAEAKVHGTTPDRVHFHEVGAVDSIVDIVGVCAGLAILGVDRLLSSPLPMGSGTIETAHGRLPVPAPAVVELMRDFPIRPCDEPGELTTPTGAAILITLAEGFGPIPPMVIQTVGYGAGAREGERMPNMVRIFLGRPSESPQEGEADSVWLLEANLDDVTGQMLGAAVDALLAAGALDAWLVSITMKKGRPGVVLSCLVDDSHLAAAEETFFRETTTFGVRRRRVERSKLIREHLEVTTPLGTVRIKVGRREGKIVTAMPEYEDCLRLAESSGVPLREVHEAALAAWRAREGCSAKREGKGRAKEA